MCSPARGHLKVKVKLPKALLWRGSGLSSGTWAQGGRGLEMMPGQMPSVVPIRHSSDLMHLRLIKWPQWLHWEALLTS